MNDIPAYVHIRNAQNKRDAEAARAGQRYTECQMNEIKKENLAFKKENISLRQQVQNAERRARIAKWG